MLSDQFRMYQLSGRLPERAGGGLDIFGVVLDAFSAIKATTFVAGEPLCGVGISS